MIDGYIALGQPLNLAEAGNSVEVIFQLQFQEVDADAPLVFMIERGGLGASWVELYHCQERNGFWPIYSRGRVEAPDIETRPHLKYPGRLFLERGP